MVIPVYQHKNTKPALVMTRTTNNNLYHHVYVFVIFLVKSKTFTSTPTTLYYMKGFSSSTKFMKSHGLYFRPFFNASALFEEIIPLGIKIPAIFNRKVTFYGLDKISHHARSEI